MRSSTIGQYGGTAPHCVVLDTDRQEPITASTNAGDHGATFTHTA
jgi:hypothetical protein